MIQTFDYQPRTRIIFGPGAVSQLGEVLAGLGLRRVLLVTDSGVAAAGHVARARESVEKMGLSAVVFDRVIENPTTRCVEKCREFASSHSVDGLVGLGGGSSLDTAKGCNFLLTNGGRMQDYWGIAKAAKPMLPLVAIPTTAGTGSECQSFALITDEQTHRKMACGDPKAAARVAILDPLLTLSQPPRVAACTGLDTLAHALESAVTRKRTPLSFLYSREAFRLGMNALPVILRQPDDVEARGRMLLAAAWAGLAIENSMLGAAHAAANPLTAFHSLVHGEAVSLMLPWVIRFNDEHPDARLAYQDLARAAEIPSQDGCASGAAIAAALHATVKRAGLATRLSEKNLKESDLAALADKAALEWTAGFNPRPVSAADFLGLYRAAL